MQYSIDLFDAKDKDSRILEGTADEAGIIDALVKAIGSAKAYGYQHVTLDVWTVEEILAHAG